MALLDESENHALHRAELRWGRRHTNTAILVVNHASTDARSVGSIHKTSTRAISKLARRASFEMPSQHFRAERAGPNGRQPTPHRPLARFDSKRRRSGSLTATHQSERHTFLAHASGWCVMRTVSGLAKRNSVGTNCHLTVNHSTDQTHSLRTDP